MANPQRDSWVKDYEAVEFELPVHADERRAMLSPHAGNLDKTLPPSPTGSITPESSSPIPPSHLPPQPAQLPVGAREIERHGGGTGPGLPGSPPRSPAASGGFGSSAAVDMFAPSSSSPISSSLPNHHHPTSTIAPPGTTQPIPRSSRAPSTKSFHSSPLNPQHSGASSSFSPPPPSGAAPVTSPTMSSNSHQQSNVTSPFARPTSRGSAYFNRVPSEEVRALGAASPSSPTSEHMMRNSGYHPHGSTGKSMVLYRVADPFATVNSHQHPPGTQPPGLGSPSGTSTPRSAVGAGFLGTSEDGALLPPPNLSHLNRASVYSTSGDSIVSLSSDSKYPLPSNNGLTFGNVATERGLVAYAYDPDEDDESLDGEEEDWLKNPDISQGGGKKPIPPKESKAGKLGKGRPFPNPDQKSANRVSGHAYRHPSSLPPSKSGLGSSKRGFFNIGMLVLLISALLCLFVVYPAVDSMRDNGRNQLIAFNARINGSGQAISDDGFNADGGDGTSSRAPVTTRDINAIPTATARTAGPRVTTTTTTTPLDTDTFTSTTDTSTSTTTSTTALTPTVPTTAAATPTLDPNTGLPLDPDTGLPIDPPIVPDPTIPGTPDDPNGGTFRRRSVGSRRRLRRGTVWDDELKIWVDDGLGEGDSGIERGPWSKRGTRWDDELRLWVDDGLSEGHSGIERDPWARRSVEKRGIVWDDELKLWVDDGLSEGDSGIERDPWAKRELSKRGTVWDPVRQIWVDDGLSEGDGGIERDPWAKRGTVWDPVLKLWVDDGLGEGESGVEKDFHGRR